MRKQLTIALAVVALAAPALAADFVGKGLKIGHPWVRESAKGMNAAAYMTITNTAKTPEVLLSVETPMARSAAVHRTSVSGGIMSMRPVTGGLAIAPGQTVTLAPEGDHIMIVGLNRPVTAGGDAPLVLVFKRAGRVTVQLMVHPGPMSIG
ncbi:hypothetical protein BH11PSE2_BH11PSE2_01320 [soil metagenome]